MSEAIDSLNTRRSAAASAVVALLVLTGVMLAALLTRTPPHPPLEIPLFALAPFLGASLAIGAAAYHSLSRGTKAGIPLAILFGITALLSFGPQKYLDPAFPQIWPAVIAAQAALVALSAALAPRRSADRRAA